MEFHVPHMPLAFGDRLCVVGDLPQLGAWDPHKGLVLEWSGGHVWTGNVHLPPGHMCFKVKLALLLRLLLWLCWVNLQIDWMRGGLWQLCSHCSARRRLFYKPLAN